MSFVSKIQFSFHVIIVHRLLSFRRTLPNIFTLSETTVSSSALSSYSKAILFLSSTNEIISVRFLGGVVTLNDKNNITIISVRAALYAQRVDLPQAVSPYVSVKSVNEIRRRFQQKTEKIIYPLVAVSNDIVF